MIWNKVKRKLIPFLDGWKKAYNLYKGNIKVDGNIVYLPIYMAGLLLLDNVSFPSLNIELSGI